MPSLRLVVLCAVLAIGLIAGSKGKTGIWAEYAGGTVDAIPTNTVGTLEFDDAQQLKFQYDKSSSYTVPYAWITNTEVARTPGHKLMRFSVPKFMTGGKRETLSITFRGDKGGPQMLTFTLSPEHASMAQSMLAMRVTKPDPAQAAAAKNAPPATDGSWADKVWKTTRNQASWASSEPDKPQQQQQQQQK